MDSDKLKNEVRDFWDAASCGEVYGEKTSEEDFYRSHEEKRYILEPYILDFARFHEGKDRDILEVGVGMGSDHLLWAKSMPRVLKGVDLTARAIEHTKKRLSINGFFPDVTEADAEDLPFENDSFDIVYSWGVLHHSPNTSKAIEEVYRVLRPDGIARIMIYHKYSLTGYMLWLRYGLLRGRLFSSLDQIYHNYLESPGTKAYTIKEAEAMLNQFSNCKIDIQLGFGDLLEGAVGQRHSGVLLSIAKKLWPRKLLRLLFSNHGLYLLIEVRK